MRERKNFVCYPSTGLAVSLHLEEPTTGMLKMMTWPYAGRRLSCFRLGRGTYSQIKNALSSLGSEKFMEYASYRVMSDGAFVHKGLESSLAVYYFRLHDIVDDELPYAILWKLSSV